MADLPSSSDYLHVAMSSGSRYVTESGHIPSQYLRRWVADQLALPAWDWREGAPVSQHLVSEMSKALAAA
jgi:hypothetical protein